MAYAMIARELWGPRSTAPEVAVTPEVAPASSLTYYDGLQEGMTQRDIGRGKYEILGADGAVMGTGYKDVASAYWEVGNDNFSKMVKPVWEEPPEAAPTYGFSGGSEHIEGTGEFRREQAYQNFERDSAAYDLAKRFWQDGKRDGRLPGNPWSAGSVGSKLYVPTGEALSDWEALGQVLNGSTAVGISHKLAANNRNEQVTGANTLYGSTPVFGKDETGKMQLLGYRTDLTPGAENNIRLKDKSSDDTVDYAYVGRSMNDPEGWGKVALVGENGAAFIGAENVDKIPGWTNKDKNKYKHSGNGLLGGIFDLLNPVLDKINPLHNKLQEIVADGLGFDTQKQAFTTIAPLVVSFFFPTAGAALGGVEAVHNNDPVGLFLSTLSAGLGYSELNPEVAAGVANAGTTVADVMKKYNNLSLAGMGVSGIPKIVDKTVMDMARGAVKGAVISGVSGKELEEVFRNALSGAVVAAVGSLVGQTTESRGAAAIAGGAAQGLINQIPRSGSETDNNPTKPASVAKPATNPTFVNYATIAREIWR